MTKDEPVVATLPLLPQFLEMAKPGTPVVNRFFIYWVKSTCCGHAISRVARLMNLTVITPLMIKIEFVTELYSDSDNPGNEQWYMNGVIDAQFDETGEMIDATIALDHGTLTKGRHELFVLRPELVAVGA